MTREDRKELNAENYPASVLSWLHKITDEIYDDFESRTCESCKFLNYKKEQGSGFYECKKGISITAKGVSQGVLCNKWEKKDET